MGAAGWFYWALLSAVFAALTAIFAKVGVAGINADLATLIRTLIILAMVAGIVAARINGFDRVGAANISFSVLARGEFALILVALAADAGLDPRLAPFVALYVLVLAVASPVLASRSATIARLLPERVCPGEPSRPAASVS